MLSKYLFGLGLGATVQVICPFLVAWRFCIHQINSGFRIMGYRILVYLRQLCSIAVNILADGWISRLSKVSSKGRWRPIHIRMGSKQGSAISGLVQKKRIRPCWSPGFHHDAMPVSRAARGTSDLEIRHVVMLGWAPIYSSMHALRMNMRHGRMSIPGYRGVS